MVFDALTSGKYSPGITIRSQPITILRICIEMTDIETYIKRQMFFSRYTLKLLVVATVLISQG